MGTPTPPDDATGRRSADRERGVPRRVRLPGFLVEEDVGLGDLIKRATSMVGVRPCGGCEQRAAALNRWVTFTSGHRKGSGDGAG